MQSAQIGIDMSCFVPKSGDKTVLRKSNIIIKPLFCHTTYEAQLENYSNNTNNST